MQVPKCDIIKAGPSLNDLVFIKKTQKTKQKKKQQKTNKQQHRFEMNMQKKAESTAKA